ncbi:acetoacetyl-CoA synthase [Roseococcus sp. SYP-B2431]|uniref:type II toxin-antitoxin system CcdA family antitoxin n=1 Tax=Roseococcus sp. SYP-B2431 TaxID=2496640 RepID=UPI00103C5B0B|nr:type II toxin-antitoxin system CcdA family antitoxin [Roseococcus sp. SYP-B2431]TCI00845.1 acetoacetyl-CoA synthase [Roseococcus sp. SYP-B2431]
MTIVTHDAAAPRRTVSVTINSDLMAKAKAAKINVSAVAEAAVAAELAQRARAALLEELRQEAKDYERFIAENGSFSDGVDAWLEENP